LLSDLYLLKYNIVIFRGKGIAMSWKEFNDWAEQENKKKGWWIPIAIALIIFILAKAYKYFS
jgi:hypothetical protein|tara:strand:+ start:227 stop:412 length:186 start_codon:yes stop_codon:yes gene_type:complete